MGHDYLFHFVTSRVLSEIMTFHFENQNDMDTYRIATSFLAAHSDLADFVGPCPQALVNRAKELLQINFSDTYERFLLDYGAGSFGSCEFYGIVGDALMASGVPNAIWYTLEERKASSLPNNAVIIGDDGTGDLYIILANSSSSSAYPVLIFKPGVPIEYQPYEKLASGFGEFLLTKVQEVLKRNNRPF